MRVLAFLGAGVPRPRGQGSQPTGSRPASPGSPRSRRPPPARAGEPATKQQACESWQSSEQATPAREGRGRRQHACMPRVGRGALISHPDAPPPRPQPLRNHRRWLAAGWGRGGPSPPGGTDPPTTSEAPSVVGVGLAPYPWDPQPPRPTLGRDALQDPFQSPNARLGPRRAQSVRRGLGPCLCVLQPPAPAARPLHVRERDPRCLQDDRRCPQRPRPQQPALHLQEDDPRCLQQGEQVARPRPPPSQGEAHAA